MGQQYCIVAMVAALALAALPSAFSISPAQGMMLQEGFVTKLPAGAQWGQGRTPGGNNWDNPRWLAIQANLTQQLADIPAAFTNYRLARQRNYKDAAEQQAAEANFRTNMEFIVRENAKGSNSYILGVTNFTDMSYEDFAAKFLMKPQTPPATRSSAVFGRRLKSGGDAKRRKLQQTQTVLGDCGLHWAFADYNPLKKGVVSPVKYQGSCGSCWAFGAAAQLESWIAMQNYTMDGANFVDLSEQMLVDCSYGSGYDGCQGGWPTAAWDFIRANGGLPSESLRSYVSGVTGTFTGVCPSATTPRALGSQVLSGYTWVSPQNDDGLVAALKTQPVFTAVAAGPEFQNYAGGAINCTSGTGLTHAIQTVGCGYIAAPDGVSYLPVYIIKNSWSQYWGYGGFAYVLRTTQDQGNCLLASGAYTVS